jgi:hypothetical protein
MHASRGGPNCAAGLKLSVGIAGARSCAPTWDVLPWAANLSPLSQPVNCDAESRDAI